MESESIEISETPKDISEGNITAYSPATLPNLQVMSFSEEVSFTMGFDPMRFSVTPARLLELIEGGILEIDGEDQKKELVEGLRREIAGG